MYAGIATREAGSLVAGVRTGCIWQSLMAQTIPQGISHMTRLRTGQSDVWKMGLRDDLQTWPRASILLQADVLFASL